MRTWWAILRDTDNLTLLESPGEGMRGEEIISIPHYQIAPLVEYLREQGYVKPVFVNEARAEDLKITHRLIDLLEIEAKDE